MEFTFGTHVNRPELPLIKWKPDSKESMNAHMLLTGGSGSGKTTLLLKIARELALSNKHVFIFDLQGNMIVKDNLGNKIGNYIDFTAWDSKYGINPFEFETGVSNEELEEIISSGTMSDAQKYKVRNSGPKVQVERIIEIIKKNFLPNMGTNQKDYLMYLFSDTYLCKDFKYNDVTSWLNELPSLADTQKLIDRIKSHSLSDDGTVFDEESVNLITNIQGNIIGLNSLLSRLEEANDKEEVEKLISDLKKKAHDSLDSYIEIGIKNYTEKNISKNKEWFNARNINAEKYSSKEAMRTIEKMSSYINALVDSGVFHSTKPPVKNGLNVINISGLDVKIQRFMVDIWLGKVFKSCKIRGTYSERSNKMRGEKFDTIVVIDESKLIAGSSRDKNDPYSYLNRIATESRGVGLGLVVGAQSAEHFPQEFLKNFDSQIILNTGIADFDAVRKSFGLDKTLLEFTQGGWGNALVKTGRNFSKVKLEVN